MPIHGRSQSHRFGKIGSAPGTPDRYHSQTKKAIQETPVRMRRAIEALELQEKARLASFKTVTIKNEPAIIRNEPTKSRLAKDRYDARVRKEGVCWSRPKCFGIATMMIRIAIPHRGALTIIISESFNHRNMGCSRT